MAVQFLWESPLVDPGRQSKQTVFVISAGSFIRMSPMSPPMPHSSREKSSCATADLTEMDWTPNGRSMLRLESPKITWKSMAIWSRMLRVDGKCPVILGVTRIRKSRMVAGNLMKGILKLTNLRTTLR